MAMARSARVVVALLISVLIALAPHPSWAWDRAPQCVPFARALSSIRLFGDAWRWWSAAAGRYNRGVNPEAGSILSFRPEAHMSLGHLAVVTRVIGNREIEVDHANWAPGAIRREVRVLDVSADNDWSAVRVELGQRDHFGAVYATNGFIYGWPITPGPEIIDIAKALQTLRGTTSAATLPVVIGPNGVVSSASPSNNRLPVVAYIGHTSR
jgi:surface antigen